MKITKISLQGFRAFDESFELKLDDGKNLLLYGENGSGKSSIYFALKRFFEERGDDIKKHRNIFSPDTRETHVRVHIKGKNATGMEHDQEFTWNVTNGHLLPVPKDSTIAHISPELRSLLVDGTRRAGFLDYRSMLRTNLLSGPLSRLNYGPKVHDTIYGEESEGLEAQLFDLVSLVILAGVRVSIAGGRETTFGSLIRKMWENRPCGRYKNVMANSNNHANAFSQAFNAKLPELETKLAEFLNYFENHQLTVKFQPISMAWSKEKLVLEGAELIPIITFRGKDIPDYHQILNEARLSALATCLFLAGVLLSDNDPGNPAYPRFLILDDALMGLELQNRIPLLSILSSDVFKNYQIFLFTHDRFWFEVSKKELGINWLKAELYEDDEAVDHPKPILISPSLSDYEHAKAYFRKKDYPACGNYLRKVCEAELARFLPEYYRRRLQQNGEIGYARMFGELYDLLIKYLQDNGCDYTSFKEGKLIKDTLLNPLSHADISTPIYRNELKTAFKFADHLRTLQNKIVAEAETVLVVSKVDASSRQWEYSIRLNTSLRALLVAGVPYFTKCQAHPVELKMNGAVQLLREEKKKDSLYLLYDRYCHFTKVPKNHPYNDFYLPDGSSLKERQNGLFS